MTVITNVSRRDLFKGAAGASGLVLGFHVVLTFCFILTFCFVLTFRFELSRGFSFCLR